MKLQATYNPRNLFQRAATYVLNPMLLLPKGQRQIVRGTIEHGLKIFGGSEGKALSSLYRATYGLIDETYSP